MNNITLETTFIISSKMQYYDYFNKMKQITGIGISEYINKYRIEVACQLLKQTEKSVTDIAFEVGFNSSKYFSTVFKQATKITPRDYREGMK